MKFGKQIKRQADPGHLNHCIAYDVLKKAITVVVTQDSTKDAATELREVNAVFGGNTGVAGMTPVARFHSLLQHELAKVNRFAKLLLRALLDTLREAHLILSAAGQLTQEQLTQVEERLNSAKSQLVGFEHFQYLNFNGFKKIAKKFDKQAGSVGIGGSLSSWFLPKLMREFFVVESLNAQVLALALGHASLRRRGRELRGEMAMPTSPLAAMGATHAGCTRTFWLTPKERMNVLCSLVKRFDVVMPPNIAISPGGRGFADEMQRVLLTMAPDGMARSLCCLSAENKMAYYDVPAFRQYQGRLTSQEPFGFRSRQTGAVSSASGELIERDGALSALGPNVFTSDAHLYADAFPLESTAGSGDVPSLLTSAAVVAQGHVPEGCVAYIDARSLKAFAGEVQQSATEGPLSCVAAVVSSRVVLRGDTPQTQGISLALDDDVRFSREVGSEPSEAVDFPYCLLEVATPQDAASGIWLDEIRSYAAIRDVQGFSIGAHAIAELHSEKVPKLPEWYEPLNILQQCAQEGTWGLQKELREAITEAAQEAQGAQKAEPEGSPPVPPIAQQKVAITPVPSPAVPRRPVADPIKAPANVPSPLEKATPIVPVEPKNFMASERTMLEWMHTVLGVAFLGVALWKYSLRLSADRGPELIFSGLLNSATTGSLALGCYSLILIAVSIAFAWYAVLTHIRRLKALTENKLTEGVFNRRAGPVAFAGVLGIALTAQLVVQAIPLLASLGSDARGSDY